MDLATAVYDATDRMASGEKFGLAAQARRAAVSVPANIAEGEGRNYSRAFVNHLSIALGSLKELETHLLLAGRLGRLPANQVEALLERSAEAGRLINGLIRARRIRLRSETAKDR